MKPQPLYLSAASDHATVTLSPREGRPTKIKAKIGDEDRELPVTYLEKDVIEVGDYVHPITKQRFNVNEQRIEHWAKTVRDMNAAGLEIPTPIDHVETQLARSKHDEPYVSAADNLGFVVDARRVGNKLRLTHQLIGEDALIKAMRNRASIYVLPEFIDEKGRKWADCIMHSAYTPQPVVSGMGGFMPIAASYGGGTTKSAPVFAVARETTNNGDTTMAGVLDDKQLEQIRSEIVANQGVSVADAAAMDEEALVKELFKMVFGDANAQQDQNLQTAAADANATPTGLSRGKLATLYVGLKDQLKLARTNGDGAVKLDDETAADRLLDCDSVIDDLVAKKRLKPTQATKAKALVRNGDKPNKLMLARNGGTNYPAQTLIELLRENDEPAEAPGTNGKPKTGDQKVALSRTAGGGKGEDRYSPEAAAKRAEEYAKRTNKKK